MKEYLKIIIVLVVFVSLITLILPEGKMKKTAYIGFSFIICLTLLTPLSNCVNDGAYFKAEEEYDYYQENDYKVSIYKYLIKQILLEEDIFLQEVSIEFDYSTNKIKKIGVKLEDSVLNKNQEHINIIVKIKECLSNRLSVSVTEIYIYE